MAFSLVHRNFFDVISVFGNAPISRDQNGRFQISIKKVVYSLLMFITIGGYFTFDIARQLIISFEDHETNGFTLFIISAIREIMSSIMFSYIMIVSVIVAKKHAILLNLLVDLENNINSNLIRFESNDITIMKRNLFESNWSSAALILWQLVINVSIVLIFNQLEMTIRLVWFSSMQFCIVLYIRMLIILLKQNLSLVRKCFGQNYSVLLASDLSILDDLTRAKNMLVKVFSGILMMNFVYDLITKLVTLFWWIYSIVNADTYSFTFNVFYVMFGYVLPFWMKLFLLTNATEGFTAEVSNRFKMYLLMGVYGRCPKKSVVFLKVQSTLCFVSALRKVKC